ncbi:MAG: hypothetical protein AAFY57_08825 [Cyanobacteria bacterium J06642_2]
MQLTYKYACIGTGLAIAMGACSTSPIALEPQSPASEPSNPVTGVASSVGAESTGDRVALLFQNNPEEVTGVDASLAAARFYLSEVSDDATLADAAGHILGESFALVGDFPSDDDFEYVAPAGNIALTDVAVITVGVPLSLKERESADFRILGNRLLGEERIGVGQILRNPGVLGSFPTPTSSPSPLPSPSISPSPLPSTSPDPIPTPQITFGFGTGTAEFSNIVGAEIDASTLNVERATAVRSRDEDNSETIVTSLIDEAGERSMQIIVTATEGVEVGTYSASDINSERLLQILYQEGNSENPDTVKQFISAAGSATVTAVDESSFTIEANDVVMQSLIFTSGGGSFVLDASAAFGDTNTSVP